MLILMTKRAGGGVAIYAYNKVDHFRKEELDIVNDEFESIWIEIRNKRAKTFYVAVPIVILTVTFYLLTNWLAYLYGRIQSPRPDVMPDRREGLTRAAGFGFACIDTQAS